MSPASYKRGTIGEAKETYRVETYGKVVGITRQVLINDDLDAFTRVPSLFGTARLPRLNPMWCGAFSPSNPNMADGELLFHAGPQQPGRNGNQHLMSPIWPRRGPPCRARLGSTARRC